MNDKGMKFTGEQLQKVRECKSAEELAALAKENGREITGEKAKELYERLNPADGKIQDAELDNVTGGECGSERTLICNTCGAEMHWEYFNPEGGGAWICPNCDQ